MGEAQATRGVVPLGPANADWPVFLRVERILDQDSGRPHTSPMKDTAVVAVAVAVAANVALSGCAWAVTAHATATATTTVRIYEKVCFGERKCRWCYSTS